MSRPVCAGVSLFVRMVLGQLSNLCARCVFACSPPIECFIVSFTPAFILLHDSRQATVRMEDDDVMSALGLIERYRDQRCVIS